MKKTIIPIFLIAAMVITAFSGCSVFNDMADEILGVSEPMPTATLSETFDPVAAAAEAEAEEKANREVYTADNVGEALKKSLVQVVAYDMSGNEKSRGTGFFFPGGVVTGLDVLRGAFTADVVVYDGGKYEVQGIRFYDEAMNLAVLACSKQDAEELQAGKWETELNETCFAVGSGTVNQGAVQAMGQDVGGIPCVATSAFVDTAVAGGPLVNVYGELLGACVSGISEDGQNYAVSTDKLSSLDMSQLISLEDFRKAVGVPVGDGSRIVTGDKGEKIYEEVLYVENESNNTVGEATALQLGYWTGAYVNLEGNEYKGEEGKQTEDGRDYSSKEEIEDSFDVFAFTAETDGKIEVIVQPRYTDDVQQLDATLVMNENMDHLADENGTSIGFFSAQDKEVDGKTVKCQAAEAEVKAGTYYIAVKLLDGWKQDIGCYYKIKVNFVSNEAQG